MFTSNAAFHAANLVVSSSSHAGVGVSLGIQSSVSDPPNEYAMQITSVLGSRAYLSRPNLGRSTRLRVSKSIDTFIFNLLTDLDPDNGDGVLNAVDERGWRVVLERVRFFLGK